MPKKYNSSSDDSDSTKSDTYMPKTKLNRVSDEMHHSKASSEFNKPMLKKHSCTDIICLVIFIIFIVAFIGLSVFAFVNGNPEELINPHDSNGNMCGTGEFSRKPFLLFFDITKCISIKSSFSGCPTEQVCVEKCPNRTLYSLFPTHNSEIKQYYCAKPNKCPLYVLKSVPVFGRCVPSLQIDSVDKVIQVFNPVNGQNETILNPNVNNTEVPLTVDSIKDGVDYITELLNLKQYFEYAYEDIQKSIWLILVALIFGMFLSFIWILMLRLIVKPMFYVSIAVVLGLLGYGTYFCIDYYLTLKNDDKSKTLKNDKITIDKAMSLDYLKNLQETWLGLSIILGFMFLVLILLLIFLRNRLRLSIELIKESSKAVIAIPSSLFWPVLPFIMQICVIVYCSLIALYLASSGVKIFTVASDNMTDAYLNTTSYYNVTLGALCDPITFNAKYRDELKTNFECVFYKFGYNNTIPNILTKLPYNEVYVSIVNFLTEHQWIPQVYVAFMFFWLTSFVIALSEMTLAGAFGSWYWSRFSNADSKVSNDLPLLPLIRSFTRAIVYHLGTLAFGSLLIAIVKLIRFALEYIDRKLKNSAAGNNAPAKFILTCLKCIFWCFEKFIKFLNHNAYIMTAIYGYSFCTSARKAFQIILNNIIRVTVIDKITSFIIFLSKLAVTTAIGVLAFFFFTKKIPIESLTTFAPDLHYYVIPIVIIIIGVYIIAKVFFDVFEMCVDTLFLCAMVDLEINDGSEQHRYLMSKNMRKILNVKNK